MNLVAMAIAKIWLASLNFFCFFNQSLRSVSGFAQGVSGFCTGCFREMHRLSTNQKWEIFASILLIRVHEPQKSDFCVLFLYHWLFVFSLYVGTGWSLCSSRGKVYISFQFFIFHLFSVDSLFSGSTIHQVENNAFLGLSRLSLM